MSIRVTSAVWRDFPLGGSERLMMLALADHADDAGHCWPSIATLATMTRLSRSQTQRVVHQLIDAGYLRVVGNEFGGYHKDASRRYQIELSRLTGSVDATGSANAPPTGSVGATGSVDATGSANSRDGSHVCAETGRTHAAQTVIEPSVTVTSLPTGEPVRPAQAAGKKKPDSCPHQEIIIAYHETLPASPRIRDWTPARAALLRARWNEDATRQNLDYWKRLFGYVAESDFLTGKVSTPGRKPFTASLEWLCKAENFAKVREGRYHEGAQ